MTMINGGLGATLLTSEPLYLGRDAKPNVDLTPEEFLERQEALIERNAKTATDQDKVNVTISNFRGAARIWWSHTIPNIHGEEVAQVLATDWEEFKKAFKKEFFTVFSKEDATINWTAFKQTQKESAYDYMARVTNAAAEFYTLALKDTPEMMPDLIWTATEIEGDEDREQLRNIMADKFEQKHFRSLTKAIKKDATTMNKKFMFTYNSVMVIKVVTNGVRETKLKEVLLKAARQHLTLAMTSDKLREAEADLGKPNGNNKSNNQTQPKKVKNHKGRQGVAGVDQSDEEEEEIAATSTKKAGAKKVSKKPKTTKKEENRDIPTCKYCSKKGHSEDECWAKQGAVRAFQEKATKQGNVAATEDEKYEGSYYNSGNA
jgi:hypothetical protein